MEQNTLTEKAKDIRDVIQYIQKFNNSSIVIYIDDRLIESPVFKSHIKDIKTIHDAGIKVSIIPGARKRINEVLLKSNISWTFKNGNRITSEESIPLIKMAAFDVCNKVMTALAGEKISAVIGNWVRARSKGVIDGFDYGTNGEIDKLDFDSIKTVLDNKFIPIYPCIGWSITGKPYNISSMELAKQIAIYTKADKLFYLIPDAKITPKNFIVPQEIPHSEENTIPALNLKEVQILIDSNKPSVIEENTEKITTEHSENLCKNQIIDLLNTSKEACTSGVSRIHILDGSEAGTLLCEIFSNLGSGTMIYSNSYDNIRQMEISDISSVLDIMSPYIENGTLLPRNENSLKEHLKEYFVYEIDESIKGCASLIKYSDNQFEIAAVAVAEKYGHIGIGPKIVKYLIDIAKKQNAKDIFILTTKTSDWFENLGFEQTSIDSIPNERKKIWSPTRNSKVLKLKF